MNFDAMPIVRVEVEQLKHTILSHMGAQNSELGEKLGEEITRAINDYHWETKVSEIVHNRIDELIRDYFRFGDGHKLVNDIVDEGFSSVLKSR